MGRHLAGPAEPTFPANAFAGYLADENTWTPGRAGVVVRQMLSSAGLPSDATLTEIEWLRLSQAYFDAAPQPMTEPLVGAW